ncbi:ketopantoate hydroxymethyltransferase [Cohnella algarum]|uniref:ketopantoate hydroxymethyltransferase n=1 Tax=Cohnella algarum TaxID=2044859 RepID=UPI001967FCD2|nr:ketopantoate hydroxymethyltransferase [Cohnella algarum]MBN2980101.1 ketopantoate hydroxymethyltransferase [Cohnella algarum]
MITQSFLMDVAEYVDGRIAKVVINGTYVITEFEAKDVAENTVALNYIVPVADVSLITTIELMDAADNVISSANVNVPITTDTLMLQNIEVKEVTS